MRNRATWIAGALGAAGVAYRTVRRRRTPAADPRADELRRRLDESKGLADEREEFEAGETPVDQALTVDEKRAATHERGRAAVRDMNPPSEG